PHHHGNLREALILAGLKLLESEGPAALTLRKCAVMAGVSHAAPANHFKGLISLKMAIKAHGHVLFADMMRQFSGKADTSAHAQLNAICEGYIAFAVKHPALFKFMFNPLSEGPLEIDDVTQAAMNEAAMASYDVLHQACIPFEHSNDDALNTETMVWSMVHGYAMLFTVRRMGSQPAQTIPKFADILPALKLRADTKA
ncbi:MAG: TetR/AcrR family transcriptional regulator, partial [Rhizobiales bacterium]|nr:TetR/AcrR family transcriptional regulator [Hyphomicrobiales bacterium]